MMSQPAQITRDQVCSLNNALPAFPRVVEQIMEALDDPHSGLEELAACIEHDPAIVGHVMALANRANVSRDGGPVNDVFTAISLVGLARVREVAMLVSTGNFLKGWAPTQDIQEFWGHCISVAVCGVELAHSSEAEIGVDRSLLAGLLHDVGQLWLLRFKASEYAQVKDLALAQRMDIEDAERQHFGVDHGEIGGWLAESWGLSQGIVQAIAHHHAPDAWAAGEPLVAVVHLSEVLCSALDLTNNSAHRVKSVSAASCRVLGLTWGPESHTLFGRIEARSKHAHTLVGQ
jgi:putative nucleotidyltransferase with HDIG domain